MQCMLPCTGRQTSDTQNHSSNPAKSQSTAGLLLYLWHTRLASFQPGRSDVIWQAQAQGAAVIALHLVSHANASALQEGMQGARAFSAASVECTHKPGCQSSHSKRHACCPPTWRQEDGRRKATCRMAFDTPQCTPETELQLQAAQLHINDTRRGVRTARTAPAVAALGLPTDGQAAAVTRAPQPSTL
jgi:hypothetical protein